MLDSDGTRYTYLWGPGRIPLSVTAKTAAGVSTTYAYHVDALGSVIAMTDAGGSVVASYTYDPWGRVTSTTGTAIAARNPLRYRSYYLDAETGLYYMPARYYDPATYRFLSADPASPSAGDPGTLNAFAYCQDDPVNLVDPSGATIDVLGDGKLGVEDCLQQMATISGDPERQAAANAAASAAAKKSSAPEVALAAQKARAAYRRAVETAGMSNAELIQYYFGPFGDVTGMSYPGVVETWTMDLNANTGVGATGGTLRVYEYFSDGAVGMKRYIYFGVATPGTIGLSDMRSRGGLKSGSVYAEAAAGAYWGRAYYWRVGHLNDEGMQSQHGPASPSMPSGSFYYILPYAVSSELYGAQSGNWYGSGYVK